MKRIFIIDTYPSGEKQLSILNECIERLYPLGYHIMLVSHLPINETIAKKANYVIYDYNNTFLTPHYTPFWWMDNGIFRIEIYNGGHTLPICRNIKSSTHMAKAMGYEEFIFMEFDVLMESEDLIQLGKYLDEMVSNDKKMLFFRPEEYRDCGGSYVYETLLFGGDLEFFTTNFRSPLNLEEWLDIPMGYTLELSFYEQLSKFESDFYLIHDHSSNIFKNSKVNLFRYGLFNVDVVHNTKYPNNPNLFIINSLVNDHPKRVEVRKDNELIYKNYLGKGHYWINQFIYDNSKIDVVVFDDDDSTTFISKSFELKESNDTYFKLKGTINYK